MKKTMIFFLLILIIGICAISHVSAEDASNSTDDVISADDIDLNENSNQKLAETPNEVLAADSDDGGNASGDTSPSVAKKSAKLKASKLTVAHKKSKKWTIKLTDANGKGIANKKITLKIFTGSKYKTVNVKTNSKGVASYNTKSLNAGKHKIKASLVDDEYNCKDITSSIKVIKQKALKIFAVVKYQKALSILTIVVLDKKSKKFLNGVKLKLLIYTGKKYKTVTLKTKKVGSTKGVAGYATNKLSVGKHKIKISPVSMKYKGSKTTSMKIKKSFKKYSPVTVKISG